MEPKDYITVVSILAGFILLSVQINAKRQDDIRQIQARRDDDRRTARLDRLNRQLSNLYGPLHALDEAGARNWYLFVFCYSHDTSFPLGERGFLPTSAGAFEPPDAGRVLEYRRRMEELFMPTNTKMEEVISQHADLIVGTRMPDPFSDFLAHVAAARLLMHRWRTDNTFAPSDWAGHHIRYPHPHDLKHLIRASFEILKRAQQELMTGAIQDVNEASLEKQINTRARELADAWDRNGPEYAGKLRVGGEQDGATRLTNTTRR